jgi:hypothetical protein
MSHHSAPGPAPTARQPTATAILECRPRAPSIPARSSPEQAGYPSPGLAPPVPTPGTAPQKKSRLSRANRPAKHTTHRRGGGAGGGGTTSCRPTKHHRHSHPEKRNSGASQANVWRQPHGGSAASTAAGRTRPDLQSQRSKITETRGKMRRSQAHRTRHAFTSQPTLAGRHASRQVQGYGAA